MLNYVKANLFATVLITMLRQLLQVFRYRLHTRRHANQYSHEGLEGQGLITVHDQASHGH